MDYTTVTPEDFAALNDVADWRFVLGAIGADFRTGSFSTAASFVAAVASAADGADHHPDIDVRYPDRVRVTLTTHAVSEVTTLDVDMARQVSRLAADMGATADPASVQTVEVAIDSLDADRIRPFWAAVLGYDEANGSLVDPLRIGPPMWFQQMDEARTDRDRFHIDISVPHDVAQRRIDASLAAGGTLVSDEFAPSWWVLADQDGNEACICTWLDRS